MWGVGGNGIDVGCRKGTIASKTYGTGERPWKGTRRACNLALVLYPAYHPSDVACFSPIREPAETIASRLGCM